MCINYSKTISAIRGQYVMPKCNPQNRGGGGGGGGEIQKKIASIVYITLKKKTMTEFKSAES